MIHISLNQECISTSVVVITDGMKMHQ